MTTGPESGTGDASGVGWTLVGAQFVLLAVLGVEVLRRLRSLSLLRGLLGGASVLAGVVVLGRGAMTLGRHLRAHPTPAQEAPLRVDGPYRWVRHPIYSGLLLAASGSTAAVGSWPALGAFLGLVGLLNVKARYEEALLRAHFPEYGAYAERTPRFIPRNPWSARDRR